MSKWRVNFLIVIVKSAVLLTALYEFYGGNWKIGSCLLPLLLVDTILRFFKIGLTAVLLILVLLVQCFIVWFMFSQFVNLDSSRLFLELIKSNLKTKISLDPLTSKRNSSVSSFNHDMIYPVKVENHLIIHPDSRELLESKFSLLLPVDFPDLTYRSKDEIISKYHKIFSELPAKGFTHAAKNPCWETEVNGHRAVQCLPYAYLLGQPKCGTSDLYERLTKHPKVVPATRKEIRWFTRGEFQTHKIAHEGEFPSHDQGYGNTHVPRAELLLSNTSTLHSFTQAFKQIAHDVVKSPDNADLITIDGGPHTFWWPTQSPDGAFLPDDIPPAQLIRELQPNAKFIVTLSDPVKRLYSDYYFLSDDLRPVKRHRMGRNKGPEKSAQQFHERCEQQVDAFNACVDLYIERLRESLVGQPDLQANFTRANVDYALTFRATQMCAHDRHSFAVGGWGRLSIGLYSLFLEKWLEHFAPSQFLILRLEDYRADPKAYMTSVFEFLDLPIPPADAPEWRQILSHKVANQHRADREPLLEETEKLLRDFYRPFNQLLAELLEDKGFLWEPPAFDENGNPLLLRDIQLLEEEREREVPPQRHPDRVNQHGIERFHAKQGIDPLDETEMNEEEENPDFGNVKPEIEEKSPGLEGLKKGNLRVGGRRDPLPPKQPNESVEELMSRLTPKNFSLDGLVYSPTDEQYQVIPQGFPAAQLYREAGSLICQASFAMDIAALKLLFWDVGVSPSTLSFNDGRRTGFHCLSMLYAMFDANSESHVFPLLKGAVSWVTPLLNDSVPLKLTSVLSSNVQHHLIDRMIEVAKWLQRAGVPANTTDMGGSTPLHHAAVGGESRLVEFLLKEMKVDPNVANLENRTPLHYAAAYGHTEIVAQLLAAGGDPSLVDVFGVRPRDIYEQPGPIPPDEAQALLHVTQRPARRINRMLQPELVEPRLGASAAEEKWGGWFGNGGWGAERLSGFEGDLECEGVDQFWADEITGEQIYRDYMGRNAPVLIRGLIHEWNAIRLFRQDALRRDQGDHRVQVSDIPYARKFGGQEMDVHLRDYIDEVKEHRIHGGSHPWYVFVGHRVPDIADKNGSFVLFKNNPTPAVLQEAFVLHSSVDPSRRKGLKMGSSSREVFVSAQWALGGEGTGAPIHYHNTAWNALVYGAKKWFLYSPRDKIMSNKQILDFLETDKKLFENPPNGEKPAKSRSCVQTAGDVMIVPESWAHGVLNIQESVAIATELRKGIWRLQPGSRIANRLPGSFNNRASKRHRKGHSARDNI